MSIAVQNINTTRSSDGSMMHYMVPGLIILVATTGLYLTGHVLGFQQLRAHSQALGVLSEWTPRLAIGFTVDIYLTVLSVAFGTCIGAVGGYATMSQSALLRRISWWLIQFFRNTPGLVLLFAFAFTLPFQMQLGDVIIPLPAEAKVIMCFSFKIAANVAEIVRGAVNSLHVGQWEGGLSIGLSRVQTFRLVILPQCLPRMLAPWMNVVALFFTAVPIASLVGIYDAVTYAGLALSSEGSSDLIMPIYLYVLAWFFGIVFFLQGLTKHFEIRSRLIGRSTED